VRVLVPALEGLAPRDRSARPHDRAEHDEADDGSQTGRSVALAGETDGDTDREQQWQPVEQTAARCGEDLADLFCRPPAAEQVVLSEPEENTGCWKGRNGEHEAAAEALESGIEPALQARLLTGGGHGHLRVWRAVWFLGTFRSRPFLDDVECAVSRSVSTVVMSSCHPGGTTSQATTGGRMCGAYSTDGRRGGRDGGRQTGKDRGST